MGQASVRGVENCLLSSYRRLLSLKPYSMSSCGINPKPGPSILPLSRVRTPIPYSLGLSSSF